MSNSYASQHHFSCIGSRCCPCTRSSCCRIESFLYECAGIANIAACLWVIECTHRDDSSLEASAQMCMVSGMVQLTGINIAEAIPQANDLGVTSVYYTSLKKELLLFPSPMR